MRIYGNLGEHAQFIIGADSPSIIQVDATPPFNNGTLLTGAAVGAATEALITCPSAHGLSTGDAIIITGVVTTPDITGQVWSITRVSATTFRIPVRVTAGGAGATLVRPFLVPINGKSVIPVVDGVDLSVSSASYIFGNPTPYDGGDISSQNFGALLARFPMYSYVVPNPLLLGTDLNALDLTKEFRDNTFIPPEMYPARVQTGTAGTAVAPNSVALLPNNSYVTVPRPGCLVTASINLVPYVGALGTDKFMPYWKIYQMHSTQDVLQSETGITATSNTPAIRSIVEVDQEPSWLEVYMTIDDGINWDRVYRLTEIAYGINATAIRLAFLNKGPSKVYLTHYAIMF